MIRRYFDVLSYLESKGVEFASKGKNASSGWVNINCVFCSDKSNHLGINLESKVFHCWLCSEKGGPLSLIRAIENCSYDEAKKIMESYQNYSQMPENIQQISNEYVELPVGITEEWPCLHLDYLEKRNFNPKYLINKYKLRPIWNIGPMAWRIFVPFFLNSMLVTYTCRSIHEDVQPKYVACPKWKSIKTSKDTLYNMDSIKNSIIILEGVTDVWRFGTGSVALSGKEISESQLSQILQRKITKALVCLDSDAVKEGKTLAYRLASHSIKVKNIVLKSGDPAELVEKDIFLIKKELELLK